MEPVIDTHDAGLFYQSMMTVYITHFIQNEPKKPVDWRRLEEAEKLCTSTCPTCRPARDFLMDPAEETCTFIEDGKSHLNGKLWITDCKYSFDRWEKPRVLTVTKTTKLWEKAHSEWEERVKTAQETFHQLPQAEMKRHLGEKYEAIMDLRMVRLPDEASEESAEMDLDKNRGSTVPQKRFRSDS